MITIKKFIILYLLLLHVVFVNQGIAHFGAKFEPPDGRVIHGLGQYVIQFYSDHENWQLVSQYQNVVGNVPLVYSAYAYIDPLIAIFDSTDFIDIVSNHGSPYSLLIGIVLVDYSYYFGTKNIPVQSILNGDWDSQIINVAQRIKAVKVPVYLRPGFEFGAGNSGFHNDSDMSADDFVDIWMHIYNIFQQQNVTNAAWVWNTVNPNAFNYMEWYPGDSYVDWWGINYFTAGQIANGDGFLADASMHDKPVMICESCPIQNGGATNVSNWNDWFVPYFDKISDTPHLKGLIYINDSWDRAGFFGDWPDSRINSNPTISMNFKNELLDSTYIHMAEYLLNPSIIDTNSSTQTPVTEFTAQAGDKLVNLNWVNPISFKGIKIIRKTKVFPLDISDGQEIYDGRENHFSD